MYSMDTECESGPGSDSRFKVKRLEEAGSLLMSHQFELSEMANRKYIDLSLAQI